MIRKFIVLLILLFSMNFSWAVDCAKNANPFAGGATSSLSVKPSPLPKNLLAGLDHSHEVVEQNIALINNLLSTTGFYKGESFARKQKVAMRSVGTRVEIKVISTESVDTTVPDMQTIDHIESITFDVQEINPKSLVRWLSSQDEELPRLSFKKFGGAPFDVKIMSCDEAKSFCHKIFFDRTGVGKVGSLLFDVDPTKRYWDEHTLQRDHLELYLPDVETRDFVIKKLKEVFLAATDANFQKYTTTVETSAEASSVKQFKKAAQKGLNPKLKSPVKQDVSVVVLDQKGVVLGGIVGQVVDSWAKVETLWVSEALRGKSVGKYLLSAFEDQARQLGANQSTLVTTSFQAPGFYKKYGYLETYHYQDFPVSGTSQFELTKTITDGPSIPSSSQLADFNVTYSPKQNQIEAVSAGLNGHNNSKVNFNSSPLHVFVRDENNEVVGGVSGIIFGENLIISKLIVPQHLRYKGVGLHLYKQIEGFAKKAGVKSVYANLFGGDTIAFFEKMGFQTQYIRLNYPEGVTYYCLKKVF
ncbi:MAG: GNAT family N-acetyltransferase [Bacteriovoracaceae bacterium]|nr:GNAT family N-acetyltransferase [Bacteriovoracaceae bacterium]